MITKREGKNWKSYWSAVPWSYIRCNPINSISWYSCVIVSKFPDSCWPCLGHMETLRLRIILNIRKRNIYPMPVCKKCLCLVINLRIKCCITILLREFVKEHYPCVELPSCTWNFEFTTRKFLLGISKSPFRVLEHISEWISNSSKCRV